MVKSKLALLAFLLLPIINIEVQACFLDSTCLPSQLCEIKLPIPIGKCVDGAKEGTACLRDRSCESKKCRFFRCEKRIAVKDGPCKHSSDCLNDQYCDDIDGRKGLRQCMNRKASGLCSKDSECMSDKCDFFKCRKL